MPHSTKRKYQMLVIQFFDYLYFLILLISLVYTGLRRDVTFFFIILTLLYCYYDWMYLWAKDYTAYEINLISGYAKDVAIYLLDIAIIFSLIVKFRTMKLMALILTLLIIVSTFGIANNGIKDYVVSFNSYIPLLLLLMSLLYRGCFVDKQKFLYVIFAFVIIPNSIYSIYQYINYDTINDFWFYKSYNAMGLVLNSWDYFRDGLVRPFGFFSNTLSLTFFCFFILLGIFLYVKKGKNLCIVITIIPIILSGTRTVIIIGLLSIILLSIRKIKANYKVKFVIYVLTIVIAFVGTLYVIVSLSSDLSSLGRVIQWASVLADLNLNPLGHGIGYAGVGLTVWPDSNVIAFMYMTGYLAVVTCLIMIFLFSYKFAYSDDLSSFFLLIMLFSAMFQNVSAVILLPIVANALKNKE